MGARAAQFSPQASLGCLRVAGRGWWILADSASCFTPLVPGPIQVEELGCLEVQAEAEVEPAEGAVAAQPPAPVSRACTQVFRVGAGGPALLTPKEQLSTGVPGVLRSWGWETLPCLWWPCTCWAAEEGT